ncbi:MAG: ribonuclease HII [Alphaproteobacteria bacterium]
MQPTFLIENNFDTKLICGIDEAGRGPLAGPVVACTFLVDREKILPEVNDSKKISKPNRLKLFENLIKNHKYGVGIVDNFEIDKINILQATKLAMKISFDNFCEKYNLSPAVLLVDGNIAPFPKYRDLQEIIPIVRGDQKSISIACASIIAKEVRDNIMNNYDQQYPNYEFKKHFGYGTKKHFENIQKFGVCPIHRKTFEPIKSILRSYENY